MFQNHLYSESKEKPNFNNSVDQPTSTIPYPHLAAFLQWNMGHWFGKRMQIKIEDENTLGFHKQQMTEKQIKKQDEKA